MFLTKFHDDRTINVASRVLTTKKYRAPLQSYIIDTNILTKFDDDWRINVASRVLTRKNTKPSCGHVCQPTKNYVTERQTDRQTDRQRDRRTDSLIIMPPFFPKGA
ncbi:hypothetical protein DPMN_162363 [Dreissena polymorpha]|uniref:Uncharacterized protein n=1 Tax=Dreissena polymorpha TaxID=45954 RepID=A0A9D4ES58_DREPO|nr:hypothetical protein DPMN_162363 [Dreissena polymorpha]